MIGDVVSKATITATVESKASITASVESNGIMTDVVIPRVHMIRSDLPNFEGEYWIYPNSQEQILPTENTSMRENFVVHAIPYREEVNQSGGLTVIIGG